MQFDKFCTNNIVMKFLNICTVHVFIGLYFFDSYWCVYVLPKTWYYMKCWKHNNTVLMLICLSWCVPILTLYSRRHLILMLMKILCGILQLVYLAHSTDLAKLNKWAHAVTRYQTIWNADRHAEFYPNTFTPESTSSEKEQQILCNKSIVRIRL